MIIINTKIKIKRNNIPISINELLISNSDEAEDNVVLQYTMNKKLINITNRDLKEHVCGLGQALYDKKIRNCKVAILGQNSYEWILSFLTLLSGNNVTVPLDKELDTISLSEIINETKCKAIIYDNSFEDIVEEIKKICPTIKEYINMRNLEDIIAEVHDDSYLEREIDQSSIGVIVYTSGTLGKSKGVMLTRKNIMSDSYAASQNVPFGSKTMLVLPIHHTFCMIASLFVPMIKKSTIYINSSLKRFMTDCTIAQPQNISLVPLFIENLSRRLWSEIDKRNETDLIKKMIKKSNEILSQGIDIRKTLFKDIHSIFGGKLEFIVCGGALLDEKYVKEFRDFGIDILNGYGMTECSPVVASNKKDDNRAGSVGQVLPGVQVRISDEGEILVKGDIVMRGYYNNEEETKKVFIDGWFKTGDLGYIDEDDFLYVTGRIKNLLNVANGKNVSAEELELKIQNINGVKEVIVYEKENMIAAEIYPDYDYFENNRIDDIKKYLEGELNSLNKTIPNYKKINEIKIRKEEFAKTTTSKIKRNMIGKLCGDTNENKVYSVISEYCGIRNLNIRKRFL